MRVAEAFGVEPLVEAHGVERERDRCDRRAQRGDREAGGVLQLVDALRKAAVLRQRPGADALYRQQAVVPFTLEEEPLLRAVAQVALGVFPAAGHAPPQAQFFQQVLHLVRVVAGHRQIVRAERAGNAFDCPATAVAAGRVFQFEQHEVVDALCAQRACRREAGDAAAGDEHARAPDGRRHAGTPGAITQRMATCDVDAGEAACDGARRVAPRQREGARAQGAADECAALHRQCPETLPHSRS